MEGQIELAHTASSTLQDCNAPNDTGKRSIPRFLFDQRRFNFLLLMKMQSPWIDREVLSAFEADGTDAHRLCTIEHGWAERFGRDTLISFKNVAARDCLIRDLALWG